MFLPVTHYADDWLRQWTTELVPLKVESVTPDKVPLKVKF